MKSKILLMPCLLLLVLSICGCDLEKFNQELNNTYKEATKPNVSCTISKQYKSSYSYYIEGVCKNDGSKDYNYLQVEFICYDKDGYNLGTAWDNTNNLLSGESWKFKAMFLGDEKSVKKCEYHEVTGW